MTKCYEWGKDNTVILQITSFRKTTTLIQCVDIDATMKELDFMRESRSRKKRNAMRTHRRESVEKSNRSPSFSRARIDRKMMSNLHPTQASMEFIVLQYCSCFVSTIMDGLKLLDKKENVLKTFIITMFF